MRTVVAITESFEIDRGLGVALVSIGCSGFVTALAWISKTLLSATQTLAKVSAEFAQLDRRVERLEDNERRIA